jgi:predicted Fe-S protein YdhL (DUF1289 family)
MITPCINVCKIVDSKCAGCGRTLDEIARWSSMSDAERNNVMNKLKG